MVEKMQRLWHDLGWLRIPVGVASIVYFAVAVWVYFETLEKLGFWEIIGK